MNSEISLYKKSNITQKEGDITIKELINLIKTDLELVKKTNALRSLSSKDEMRSYKTTNLPAVTVSGSFGDTRKAANIKEHSGFIQIDFDNIDIIKFKDVLYQDPFTCIGFISPSGNGIKLIVKINGVDHLAAFHGLELYYKTKYNLEIDKSCKDVSRLMFLCHDDQIYQNNDSALFSQVMEKTINKHKKNTKDDSQYFYNRYNFDQFISDLEKMKIDLTADYNEWIKIGFALVETFGKAGRSYYHRIGSISPKYDEIENNKKYDNYLEKNDGRTKLPTIFLLAKNYGLKVPANEKQIPFSKNIDGKTKASSNEFDYYKNMSIDELQRAPIPDSKDIESDLLQYGFYIKDGRFWTKRNAGMNTKENDISNFVFSVIYQFDNGTNDTIRLIKWFNADDKRGGLLELYDSQLSNMSKFKEILFSRGCMFFKTGEIINRILSKQTRYCQSAVYIEQLGYNRTYGVYTFSNAMLFPDMSVKYCNELGLIQSENGIFYIPHWAQNNRESSNYKEERGFFYNAKSSISLIEYIQLMKTAYGNNGLVSVLYLINSLLHDLVFKECGFFPYLFLFGEPGTGKTSLINFLLSVLGDNIQGISVKGSSYKGAARKLSQFQNALTYLKEYDNDISSEFDSTLKTAYDGVGYTIALKTTDNQNKTFNVTSGIMIDGNILPVNQEAVFDRIILLELRNPRFSEEQKNAFEMLNEIEKSTGFSNIIKDIFSLRKKFKSIFGREYIKFTELLKKRQSSENLTDRAIRHISFLLATFEILNIAGENSNFDKETFVEELIDDSLRKEEDMRGIKDTTVFFEAFAYKLSTHGLEIRNNEDYILESDTGILFLNFQAAYVWYSDYCKLTGQKKIDKTSLRKKLTNESYPPFIPFANSDRNQIQKGRKKKRFYMFQLMNSESNEGYFIENTQLIFE